jgi:drug/metabolite transporter (DMT)-like permease
MDPAWIGRVLILMVVGGVLLRQSNRYTSQPNRKRALQFGAGAMFCFAGFNLALATGALSPLAQAVGVAGMLLFTGAAVSLVLSFRSGERAGERKALEAEARAYIEQRKQERSKPEQKG